MIDLDASMHEEAKQRFEKMIKKYMKRKGKTRVEVIRGILKYLGENQRQALVDAGLHFEDVQNYLNEIETKS